MKVSIFTSTALLLLSGCVHQPYIRDAVTGESAKVKPLSQYLTARDDVIIIFVHGMSDTCPGYALDDDVGWLKKTTRDLIQISDSSSSDVRSATYQDLTYPTDPDGAGSTYTVARRQFRFGKHDITAFEFTWSGLTQWVKTKQLGFDLTQPLEPAKLPPGEKPKKPEDLLTCIKTSPAADGEQERVFVNSWAKEGLMDRNLADAVIYIGPYGGKIDRAMADVFCRALTDDVKNEPCDWEKAVQEGERQRTIIFVTHSLGSRIVYDTLLEMSRNKPVRPYPTFDDSQSPTVEERKKVASEIDSQNSVLYMMANQYPLLGLAYLQPQYKPKDPTEAPVMMQFHVSANSANNHVQENSKVYKDLLSPTCDQYSISCTHLTNAMDVIAFSDANDLLTWRVAKNYAQQNPNLHFTNVYVHNSMDILWLVEDPGTAHTGYFLNDTVRKVIVCGGANDAVGNGCN